jgi:hypothetical protein
MSGIDFYSSYISRIPSFAETSLARLTLMAKGGATVIA